MAQTKVKLISDGVIVQGNLHPSHGITTADIGEGSNLYYTDARVGSYLSTNSFATESYVGTQIANLVDSSPSALNTLNELAAALGDDANFSTTVTNSIALKAPLASPSFTGNATFASTVNIAGTLTLDQGSLLNGIINTPASLRINIDSNNNNTGEKFVVGHNQTNIDNNNELFVVEENGNATFAGSVTAQDMRLQASGTTYLNIGNDSTGSASTDGASIGYFTGQTSLQIVQRENDAMIFSTNSDEKMRIDSNGSIGMGANSSSYRLRIKTDATVTNGVYLSAGTGNGNHALYVEDKDGTAEYFAVRGDGEIRLNASSGHTYAAQGIRFGTNASANNLDDYEEGTWTPTISHNDGTGAIPLTVSGSGATYVKVGRVVHVRAYLTNVNPNGNAGGSGAYYAIRSLPFTASADGAWDVVYANTNMNSYGGYWSGDNLYFMRNGTNGQRSAVHINGTLFNAFGANASFMFQAVYTTP